MLATVNLTSVLRVYVGNRNSGWDRCLCLVESTSGSQNVPTTDKVFITCRRGELPEGVANLSVQVSVSISRTTPEYPQPQFVLFLRNKFEKKTA